MKKIFNYNKIGVAIADEIVESMYLLTRKYCEGKANTPEYEKLNNEVNEKFMRFCVDSIPTHNFTSMEDVKNPMIHKNQFFTSTFDTVLAQAITPAIPTVLAQGYDRLYEVTQTAWGRTFVLYPAY